MDLDIISYHDLMGGPASSSALKILESALLTKGIVGIREVPAFLEKSRAFIKAARDFSLLKNAVKQQYAPDREKGDIAGYELGAERFTLAVFYSISDNTIIHSRSQLREDARYSKNQFQDGSISYGRWQKASLERYHATGSY